MAHIDFYLFIYFFIKSIFYIYSVDKCLYPKQHIGSE